MTAVETNDGMVGGGGYQREGHTGVTAVPPPPYSRHVEPRLS
jgi:hypothetical protein